MEYTKRRLHRADIKLNTDAKWSDGTPVTSKDVVYTFDGQLNNDKLPYHAVVRAVRRDGHRHRRPDRRRELQDPGAALQVRSADPKVRHRHPDRPRARLGIGAGRLSTPSAGGTEIPHSGPYDLVAWNANQKIFDLRDDWWAVKAGRIAWPAVKRIVMVNIGGQVGQNMDTVAQRIVNNEFDSALDMRSLGDRQHPGRRIPKITTHTGNDRPTAISTGGRTRSG